MKKRRLLSIVLSLCMVLALMPQMVFAEEPGTYDELQGRLSEARAGDTVTLEKDYIIDKTLTLDHTWDVTLDLNGHVIKMTGNGSVIKVRIDANLTLKDSNPTATHTDTSLPAGGVIIGGNAGGGAGGVQVTEGSFVMEGGTIRDCTTAGTGGGVNVADGKFTMTGGTICDCTAVLDGDAVASNIDSVIYANGGTIIGEVVSWGKIQSTDEADGCTEFYGSVDNGGTISYGIFYGGISGSGTVEDTCHTVSFDLNGVSGSIPKQWFVNIDKAQALKPAEPTKEGYAFTGWYTNEELETPYDFESEVKDNITLYAGWEEEQITLTVPFTTTVEVKGNASPEKTTFNLKVVDSQGKELQPNDYNVGIIASVETDGAGDYNGNLTFTGTASAILSMFDNERDEYGYIYVKQADINDSNWTVDGAVWGLFHRGAVVALSEDEEDSSPILIFPAENNGTSYSVKDGETAVDKMTFINTYTKSEAGPSDSDDTNGDADNDSKADAEDSAKTGDNTNLALWLSLMLLSGAGITGVTVYTRRKRTNE